MLQGAQVKYFQIIREPKIQFPPEGEIFDHPRKIQGVS
jgi:hypothetical protein